MTSRFISEGNERITQPRTLPPYRRVSTGSPRSVVLARGGMTGSRPRRPRKTTSQRFHVRSDVARRRRWFAKGRESGPHTTGLPRTRTGRTRSRDVKIKCCEICQQKWNKESKISHLNEFPSMNPRPVIRFASQPFVPEFFLESGEADSVNRLISA